MFILYAVSPELAVAVTFTADDMDLFLVGGEDISLRWSPESLVPYTFDHDIAVDINLVLIFFIPPDKFMLIPLQMPIKTNTNNDGIENITIPRLFNRQCPYTQSGRGYIFLRVCAAFFKISISDGQDLDSSISIWSGLAFALFENPDELSEQCDKWRTGVMHPSPALLGTLPPCPPQQLVANFDLSYQREDINFVTTPSIEYHSLFMSYFHPEIDVCYRQSV